MKIRSKAKCLLASLSFWEYCKTVAPDFYKDERTYLKYIADKLEEFYYSEDRFLLINLPPRFGKSRTATLFTQWILGKDTKLKIMTGSYNQDLSKQFSGQVRNAIQEEKDEEDTIVYSDIFPHTKIKFGEAKAHKWTLEGNNFTNYLATSPKGSATGFGADFLIIDDLIKSLEDANNSNVLEKQWEWFTGTMLSRLQGKRKVIIIMTRWTKKDLAGRVIKHCEEVLKIPVIQVCMKAYDGKKHLCEDVLPAREYEVLKKTIPEATFNANYNQETVDQKGALYKKFLTYNTLPECIVAIENYTDTADTGSDYLCSISYAVDIYGNAYILDVVYTKAAMEVTEGLVAKSLFDNNVTKARIESNSGGRGFARSVKAKLKDKEYEIEIRAFHQGENKQTRILTGSSLVENTVYYPADWEARFSQYAEDMKEYQREGKNEHDDCADATTGVVEYAGRKARRKNSNFSWFNKDKKKLKSEVIE